MNTTTKPATVAVYLRGVQICAICGCLCQPGETVDRSMEWDATLNRALPTYRHRTMAACDLARGRSAAFWTGK